MYDWFVSYYLVTYVGELNNIRQKKFSTDYEAIDYCRFLSNKGIKCKLEKIMYAVGDFYD